MRRYRAQFLCLLSRVLAERASTGSASLKTPRRKWSSKAEVRRIGKGVVPWRPWMVLKWNLFSLQFWPTTQEKHHPELSIVMVGRRLQRPFRSLSCGRTDWQKPRHSEFMFFCRKTQKYIVSKLCFCPGQELREQIYQRCWMDQQDDPPGMAGIRIQSDECRTGVLLFHNETN